MSREEMLAALGISDEGLRDLIRKLDNFRNDVKLTDEQLQLLDRAHPSLTEAVIAFGGKATEQDVMELFEGERHEGPVICCYPLNWNKAE